LVQKYEYKGKYATAHTDAIPTVFVCSN